jgi:hypothetical protein
MPRPTPLAAVNGLTFLASIGTGVVWNGISFIAEQEYHFDKRQTITLYIVMGATYIGGAFWTGSVLRTLASILQPRTALAMIFICEALICLSIGLVRQTWMLWIVASVVSVLSSWQWPIVESYLTAGRHGSQMREAMGWWNICWTSAVAVAMLLIAPLIKDHGRLAIVMVGAVHLLAIAPLCWFAATPGVHDDHAAATSVQTEYPLLLRAARMLLPLSYVLNSAMSPLLPFMLNNLGVEKGFQTPLTSVWMCTRVLTMAVMWRVGFWHGRWGTLLLGGLAMTFGFSVMVSATGVLAVITGFAAFGMGMGIIYFAALYYAMAVGRAEVDAGGTHEALIGVGYTIGPLAGLASIQFTSTEQHFSRSLIAIVFGIVAIGVIGVLRVYLFARRLRRRSQ